MRKIIALFLFLAMPVAAQTDNYGGMPRQGILRQSALYSNGVFTGYQVQVSGGVSGATQFQCTAMAGFPADYFNTTWRVRAVDCDNVTAGTVYDITDYTATGIFTTVSADGSWATGDILEVMRAYVLDELEYGSTDAIATGVITTYTSGTSITVGAFAGLNTTLLSIQTGAAPRYAIRVDQVDETADISLVGEWRALTALSSAGVCTIAPTMLGRDHSSVLDAGDIVSIVPIDLLNPPGRSEWVEVAAGGGAGTAVFSSLIGKPEGFIPVDAVIRFLYDNSASAVPANTVTSVVTGFTPATGTVAFSGNFSTASAIQDKLQISWGASDVMLAGAKGFPASGWNLAEMFARDTVLTLVVDGVVDNIYGTVDTEVATLVTNTTEIDTSLDNVGAALTLMHGYTIEIDTSLDNVGAALTLVEQMAEDLRDSLVAEVTALNSIDVAVDNIYGKVDTEIAAINVVADSINLQRTVILTTETTPWAASQGPVTATAPGVSQFAGTGIWRIEELGAVNVDGNDGTATNMIFACGQLGGAAVAMSATSAIASDAAGSGYVVSLTDTSATPEIHDIAANTVTRVHPITLSNLDYWVTPPGSWLICDSTTASNAGTRYLFIRATPITAGATLVAQ